MNVVIMQEDSGKKFKPCVFNGSSTDLPSSDITCVQFSPDSCLFSIGDMNGNVNIYHKSSENRGIDKAVEFSLYSSFKSHEPEFDFLKSSDISEQIVQLKWLRRHSPSYFVLTTNHKIIKLWKLTERNTMPQGLNFEDDEGKRRERPSKLVIPRYTPTDTFVEALPRKIYQNAHTYQIHSISTNYDNMCFLSSDELRINLWNLEVSDNSYNVVDIKPECLEDLSEVITSTTFHPNQSSIFTYTTSIGGLRLCDMRQKALCDTHYKSFQEEINVQPAKSFFSEIITNTSDVKFNQSGTLIAIRNYMTVKVWDTRGSQTEPLQVFPVHDQYRCQLCKLYENDCIFDRFELCWTHDDRYIVTGSYNGIYKLFDVKSNQEYAYEASTDILNTSDDSVANSDKFQEMETTKNGNSNSNGGGNQIENDSTKLSRIDSLMYNCEDFDKKLFHVSLHPNDNYSTETWILKFDNFVKQLIKCKVSDLIRDVYLVYNNVEIICKSCICVYLDKYEKCPICKIIVYKNENLRIDEKKQKLIYKIIPGIFTEEYTKRQNFDSDLNNEFFKKKKINVLLIRQKKIAPHPKKLAISKNKEIRYLQCAYDLTLGHLRQLLCRKLVRVTSPQNIILENNKLSDSVTLLEFGLFYNKFENNLLKICYQLKNEQMEEYDSSERDDSNLDDKNGNRDIKKMENLIQTLNKNEGTTNDMKCETNLKDKNEDNKKMESNLNVNKDVISSNDHNCIQNHTRNFIEKKEANDLKCFKNEANQTMEVNTSTELISVEKRSRRRRGKSLLTLPSKARKIMPKPSNMTSSTATDNLLDSKLVLPSLTYSSNNDNDIAPICGIINSKKLNNINAGIDSKSTNLYSIYTTVPNFIALNVSKSPLIGPSVLKQKLNFVNTPQNQTVPISTNLDSILPFLQPISTQNNLVTSSNSNKSVFEDINPNCIPIRKRQYNPT
ncbi:hypothetical protein A3Q56_02991 [Intoshia linei]|uniref:Serine/threonine-protein phosphatase 2A 55 kDa regulatory subunit B n=1 Tax=Intoshia linei TaxID=1819745 RepID=A0A177B6G3_9BILA|nr:hypothetical protein A3Q56_02991 [Intoshia linei]